MTHAFSIVHGPFALAEYVSESGLTGKIDGIWILASLHPNLMMPGTWFPFMRDGPLDMRMDPTRGQSARRVVADG